MKRIIMVLTVAAVMSAMMVAMAVPAIAAPCTSVSGCLQKAAQSPATQNQTLQPVLQAATTTYQQTLNQSAAA